MIVYTFVASICMYEPTESRSRLNWLWQGKSASLNVGRWLVRISSQVKTEITEVSRLFNPLYTITTFGFVSFLIFQNSRHADLPTYLDYGILSAL
jgi:hypothetical protein